MPSAMSPRTVIVGWRSLRRSTGSSQRTSTAPTCDSAMRSPLAPARVRSAIRAGSRRMSPAARATTCTVRISSRTAVTGTPLSRNCSCCATAPELSPMACKRSCCRLKCRVGVRVPQSVLTVRIMGLACITRCTWAGDGAQHLGVRAADAVGDGKRRIRAEHQLRDSHARLRRQAGGNGHAQTLLEAVARLLAVGAHDDLGKRRIGQFRPHRQGKSAVRPGQHRQ